MKQAILVSATLLGGVVAEEKNWNLVANKVMNDDSAGTGMVDSLTNECNKKEALINNLTAQNIASFVAASAGDALTAVTQWCENGSPTVATAADASNKFCTFVNPAGGTALSVTHTSGQLVAGNAAECNPITTPAGRKAYYSFVGPTFSVIDSATALTLASGDIEFGAPKVNPIAGTGCSTAATEADCKKFGSDNQYSCKWANAACATDFTLQDTFTAATPADLSGPEKHLLADVLLTQANYNLLMTNVYAGAYSNTGNTVIRGTTQASLSGAAGGSPTSDQITAINNLLEPVCKSAGGTWTTAFADAQEPVCTKKTGTPTDDDAILTAAEMEVLQNWTQCQANYQADAVTSTTSLDLMVSDHTAITDALAKAALCQLPHQFGADHAAKSANRKTLCKYTASTVATDNDNLNAECVANVATAATSAASSVTALSASAALAAGVIFAQ